MNYATASAKGTVTTVAASLLCGRSLENIILLAAAFAVGATSWLGLRAATEWGVASRLGVTILILLGAAWIASRIADVIPKSTSRIELLLSNTPLWVILLLGLFLRIVWLTLFPAVPGSDGGTLLQLAQRLASEHRFETAGTLAYWPPGYSLFLVPWVLVFGEGRYAWELPNLMLPMIGALGVSKAADLLAGKSAGKLAALVYLIWPNLIAFSGTPEKESLLIALLPLLCWLVIRLTTDGNPTVRALLAGFLLGAAILIQPSMQLLLPALMTWTLLHLRPIVLGTKACAGLCLGAMLIVAPWTYRNYEMFGSFVLVSTNGGENLYRANNPLANGGYTERGQVDLSGLDELARDRQGKALAFDWMRNNVGAFAQLVLEKQVRFMGDDAVGVYNTFKVGKASENGRLYLILKSGANAWWMFVWIFLAGQVIAARRAGLVPVRSWRSIFWFWIYLFALHSIFESAGKYHVPMLWVLATLVGCYAFGMRTIAAR